MTSAVSAAPMAYPLADAVVASGLSKTHLETAIAKGELKVKRSSKNDKGEPQGKRLILAEDLQAYLQSLPDG